MLLISIYRPPDTSVVKWNDALFHLQNAILNAQAHGKYSNICITGDVNFPDANWLKMNGGEEYQNSSEKYKQMNSFGKFMMNNFLVQTIDQPTREDNILDIFVTNNVNILSHHIHIMNKKLSDHETIVTKMNLLHGDSTSDDNYNSDKLLYDTIVQIFDTKNADLSDWERFGRNMNKNIWENIINKEM